VLAIDEYMRLRELPQGRLVMYQRWRSLLFLHFSCDPAEVQRLLPDKLEVDTFDGRAWVGLVPFRMEGIRPRFSLGVPGASAFPETNVRTYVHRGGREPGVWFFSLDAASPLACRVARGLWRLPYHEASMTVTEQPSLRYVCSRQGGRVASDVCAEVGQELGPAAPGTLEFFLVERYLLYASGGGRRSHDQDGRGDHGLEGGATGRLLKGRVHHPPYPLFSATATHVEDRLVEAAGIEPRPFEHALFSPGVDVRIYRIEGVNGVMGE
jgi:uncharacterized protein